MYAQEKDSLLTIDRIYDSSEFNGKGRGQSPGLTGEKRL